MTLKELRETLIDAPAKQWFSQEVKLLFRYPYLNTPLQLTGISAIYEYVLKNEKDWSTVANIPQELHPSLSLFSTLKQHIISFVNSYKGVAANQISQYWYNVERISQDNSPKAFAFNSPDAKFLLDIYSDKPTFIQGAYGYLTNQLSNSFSNRDYFTGAMLAYEFKQQDYSEIQQRRNKEKASLNKLRSEFEQYLTVAENNLSEFLQKAKDNSQNNSEAISTFQAEKEKSFESWFEKVVQEFSEFDESSRVKMAEQEDLYRNLLRLEKPAKYWNERASKLKAEGQTWLKLLSALVLIAAGSLFLLLWLIPEGMILNIFKGEASAIKWTIVYITFISFLAFGIKTLSKVTFSAFHLARDAEEREQLAYFYLALKKDGNIDDTERHLIMQSLFSRSDTGLLKDDSSPTMPGNIIDKVVNVNK